MKKGAQIMWVFSIFAAMFLGLGYFAGAMTAWQDGFAKGRISVCANLEHDLPDISKHAGCIFFHYEAAVLMERVKP